MHHNRAASYTWVFPGDTLTAGHQAESIRRLADALGMTIVREYEDEDEEYGSGPGGRPQFHRMMDAALSESRPFGAVTSYGRWPFAPCAADPAKYARELQDAGVDLLCARDKPPRSAQAAQGPGVPAQEGGLRAQGDRRRLVRLQPGRQPGPATGLSSHLHPTHHPRHVGPPCTAETDSPVTRALREHPGLPCPPARGD